MIIVLTTSYLDQFQAISLGGVLTYRAGFAYADIRETFTVIGRTKEFKVIGRTKEFTAISRQKEFKVG